jgi:hypothetical protein
MKINVVETKFTKKGEEKTLSVNKLNTFLKTCKTGYEIIDNKINEYVKPYIDIDISNYEDNYEIIKKNKKKFLNKVIKFLKKTFKCNKKSLAISETIRKTKISYHIVIHDRKIKYDELSQYVSRNKEEFKKLNIDTAVYCKYQKFRLIMSHKENDNSICQPITQNKDLSKHLITNVDSIDEIVSLSVKEEAKEIVNKKENMKKIKNCEKDRLFDICDNLNANRLIDRREWSLIIMAIYNISYENDYITGGIDMIHTISAKVNNYEKEKVDDFVKTLSYNCDGKKIGYLMSLLKEDCFARFQYNIQRYEKNYSKIKEEFEKNAFKIMTPFCLCIKDENELIIYKKNDFYDAYSNLYYYSVDKESVKQVLKKHKFMPIWLNDENIRTYKKLEFYPDADKCPVNHYNLFDGLEINKIKTDEEGDISLILEHVRKLAGNSDDTYNYLINWLADIVQNPSTLRGIALIFVSEQGAGKNVFTGFIGNKILGENYYYSTCDTKHIYGGYAEGLKHKLLINMDEASGRDNFENSDKLKNLITAPKITYEKKYVSSIMLNNFARFIFTTNNDTSIKIEYSDRRFMAFLCDNSQCNNKEYFTALIKSMNDERVQKSFYKYLISVDISEFDFINDRPKTEIYQDMMKVNIPKEVLFMINLLENENIKDSYKATKLYNKFIEYLKDNGYGDYKTNTTKFGRNISKLDGLIKKRSNGIKYVIDKKILCDYLVKKSYVTEEDMKDIKKVSMKRVKDICDDDDENEFLFN